MVYKRDEAKYNKFLVLIVISVYLALIGIVLITWDDMHPAETSSTADTVSYGLPELESLYKIVEILD